MSDIEFQLNRRIPEEAALMDYLRRFPEDRHAEQLRRLALKGFQQEIAERPRTYEAVVAPTISSALLAHPQPPDTGDMSEQVRPQDQSGLVATAEGDKDLSLNSLRNVMG